MKKILLLLFVILSITNTHAQTHEIDSLKQALQNEKTDTGRVLMLASLSSLYLQSKPDTTMVLAMQALSLSQHIGFIKGEAASLFEIGNAYSAAGNLPKALEVWLHALKLNEKINNLSGIAGALNNMANIYSTYGEYYQAIDYLLKAKKLNEQMGQEKKVTVNLNNIGRNYLSIKLYDSAMLYFQQAYQLATKINYPRSIGVAFSRMGAIYAATGQNALALEYYRQSIPYIKLAETGRDWNLSGTFLDIAKLFENTGQVDSALFYANRSFNIGRSIGSVNRVIDASNFLSAFYDNRRNADSALFYIKIAKATNDSVFSKEKTNQLQSLSFDEKLRQQEIATAELKAKEERKNNLQYAGIAIGLITFIILFFALSRSIIVKTKFIEFFGVLGLLAVFEFINLFIHPYLSHATNDSPVLMLLILIGIGALLVPLHHRLEKWITKIMVEKNKKIRLAAAKKTIATLEG